MYRFITLALFYITNVFCRYSCDDCIFCDIFCHYRSGCDYGVFSDSDTGKYYRARPDPSVTAYHNRGCNQRMSSLGLFGMSFRCYLHPRAYENSVVQRYAALIEKGAAEVYKTSLPTVVILPRAV